VIEQKIARLKETAARKVAESKTSKKAAPDRQLKLELWPDEVRGVPNAILRGALSGASIRATALSLNACPYLATFVLHLRPLQGFIGATTILTWGAHAGRGFRADGRGGLFGHLLEHEVLQPPSWATVPYGTLLAAQRLMTVGDVNRCGCSSCTARYGAALKRRPLAWLSRSTGCASA